MAKLGSQEWLARLENEPAKLAAEVCLINVADLDTTLQQHASLRAFVNSLHEATKAEETRAEWELTRTRARVLLQAKNAKDESTGKDKTVAVLSAEVDVHEDVVQAMDHLLTVQQKRGALRAMSDALEDRLQMLIQISAKQREEMRDARG